MFKTKTSVAALSVLSNTVLVVLKIAAGLATGSVSVVSEAVHSGIDLVAAVIALVSVHIAGRPPDESHNFGHGKVENVSGTVEGVLIFLAAGLIIYEAVQKLLYGVDLHAVELGIAVMGLSVLLNTAVSRRLLQIARRTDSVALEADAYHLSTDVLTSLGVFAGLVVVRLTGIGALDPLIAIAVALVIVKAAFAITVKSFRDLLDHSLSAEEHRRIAEVFEGHSGGLLVGYHQVRSRKAGSERHVDVHLVMNRAATVQESHALCDHLEEHLRTAVGASSLSIHVEPCENECRSCVVECRTSEAEAETGE